MAVRLSGCRGVGVAGAGYCHAGPFGGSGVAVACKDGRFVCVCVCWAAIVTRAVVLRLFVCFCMRCVCILCRRHRKVCNVFFSDLVSALTMFWFCFPASDWRSQSGFGFRGVAEGAGLTD